MAGVLLVAVFAAGCSTVAGTSQLARPVSAQEQTTALPEVAPAVATSTTSALRPFVPTATSLPTPLPTASTTPLPSATPWPTPTVPPPSDVPPTSELPAAELAPTEPATAAPLIDTSGTSLNGIPFEAIAVLPPDVADNVRAIAQRGRELGRNPRAFSKLGDSLVLTETYLTRFDRGNYTLGPYAALQPTIDHYAGSFSRYGVATKVGLYAAYATRPGVANAEWCGPDEHMLACEFRLHNPSVILIRIGTNDADTAAAFEQALIKIVTYAIDNGVIPVLGTKADRFEGDNRNNEVIRQVAADFRVPLWDFDLVASTLPGRGLGTDSAHLSAYKNNDYTDPVALQTGYPVNDLSALVVLDALRAVTATP